MKKISLLFVIAGMLLVNLMTGLATAPDVSVVHKEGIGDYLVDAKGMTLYWSKLDAPGGSACKGQCLIQWPPFYKEAVLSSSPLINATDFGTIIRTDGKKQNTFRGYPLYYYTMDKKSGDTNGQNLNKVWSVMDPGHFRVIEEEHTGYSVPKGTSK